MLTAVLACAVLELRFNARPLMRSSSQVLTINRCPETWWVLSSGGSFASVPSSDLPPHWFLPRSPAEEWVQANQELVERNQYKVKDLPVGEKMLFRVVAVNIAGRSPPATLPQAVTIREIMGQRRHLASFTGLGRF